MATTQGSNPTPIERSTEELRREMCRLIDELATARSDRAAALKAEFEALWKKMPAPGETIH
jgi:hypothetical protein